MRKRLKAYNGSVWFLYPLLRLVEGYDKYLDNTYLYHYDYPGLIEHVHLVFKFDGKIDPELQDLRYLPLEKSLKEHPSYFNHQDINGGEFVCFTMEIPDELSKDYYHILRGEYSQISPLNKQVILRKFPYLEIEGILTKSEEAKQRLEKQYGIEIGDQEVWSKLDESLETLTPEKYPAKLLYS